jgi:hypothetical protein
VSAGVIEMRDMVHINVHADLPIQASALPFADRVELRFGKAFPVALVIDRPALDRLAAAIEDGRQQLGAARGREQR